MIRKIMNFIAIKSIGMARQWFRHRGRSKYACCAGQAAVETVFAMILLVLLILVTVQLFLLTNATIVSLTEGHRKTLVEAHGLDASPVFRRVEVVEKTTVDVLPGMQWALRYMGADHVQDAFDMQRSQSVYAGSFQGRGESLYALKFRFILWSKGMQGRRMQSLLIGLSE